MLAQRIKQAFSFNILRTFRELKEAIRAPIKHIKAATEPTGTYYSVQTNTTEEAFDEVSSEWQAYVGNNAFDMQTYNYLQNAQLANFGTVDNPLVIFTADAPFRYIGCSGAQNEDDYQSHELLWMMLREGPLQRCAICGQVFKLVRLRNEYSSEMDYYMSNFNKLWFEDLGEHDTVNNLSVTKANTHFEHTLFEQPEDTVYSLISSDEHDRILTDPAYRMQRQTQADLKARVYLIAMEDYENNKIANSPYRHPISKVMYENLITSEALIRKFDRSFRHVLKFESRKYVDPVNHGRREARMLERSQKRWDGGYTLYTGTLTEEEQRYRDYFETDLQQNREDERLEQFLDRQELLSDQRYGLRHFDFQQSYTVAPQDDQTSYVEKKIFKFKHRRALDTPQDYQRRNNRMIQSQKSRFQQQQVQDLIQNYLREPLSYQSQYINFVKSESVAQYQDYFQTDSDQLESIVLQNNKVALSSVFENWQLPRQDTSTFKTFPLPQWNNELGFWSNSVALIGELSQIGQNTLEVSSQATLESISQSSLVSASRVTAAKNKNTD